MEYRQLGRSGLRVSEIGLGGNNFGGRTDEKTSIEIIGHASDSGVTFIDTADVYTGGKSEELVGKAIKGKRSQFTIATKFGNPRSIRPGRQPASRSHIVESVEGSLRRLGTDHIDLYYLHNPDPGTPIEETLRALDDLVRAGKVRYLGCSNLAAWQVCGALWTSRLNKLEAFIVVESRYNLLDRAVERELVPCCQSYGIGLIPYAPLGSGLLTGKYRRGQPAPAGTRLADPMYSVLLKDADFNRLDKLEAFALERGHTVGELAIAWLLSHPWLGSVIAGVTSTRQLDANVAAANWKLTAEDISAFDKIA